MASPRAMSLHAQAMQSAIDAVRTPENPTPTFADVEKFVRTRIFTEFKIPVNDGGETVLKSPAMPEDTAYFAAMINQHFANEAAGSVEAKSSIEMIEKIKGVIEDRLTAIVDNDADVKALLDQVPPDQRIECERDMMNSLVNKSFTSLLPAKRDMSDVEKQNNNKSFTNMVMELTAVIDSPSIEIQQKLQAKALDVANTAIYALFSVGRDNDGSYVYQGSTAKDFKNLGERINNATFSEFGKAGKVILSKSSFEQPLDVVFKELYVKAAAAVYQDVLTSRPREDVKQFEKGLSRDLFKQVKEVLKSANLSSISMASPPMSRPQSPSSLENSRSNLSTSGNSDSRSKSSKLNVFNYFKKDSNDSGSAIRAAAAVAMDDAPSPPSSAPTSARGVSFNVAPTLPSSASVSGARSPTTASAATLAKRSTLTRTEANRMMPKVSSADAAAAPSAAEPEPSSPRMGRRQD